MKSSTIEINTNKIMQYSKLNVPKYSKKMLLTFVGMISNQ